MILLLRRLVDVRDGEIAGVLWAFAYFFFLLCSFYVLRPIREEMGVAGGVAKLPWLFTGTFAVTLAVAPLWGALSARLPRRRLVPIAYRLCALNVVAFYVLLKVPRASGWAAPAIFIWISVYNLFVVSVFWSVMADLYRPEQGRRLFGFVAAGGTAGAIAGPLLTTALAPRLGPASLLLVSAAFLELATQCMRRLGRRDRAIARDDAARDDHGSDHDAPDAIGDRAARRGDPLGGGALEAVPLVARSGYLLTISLHVLLFTLTATFLYFEQASITARAITDPGRRTALFASIDLAVNALSLVVQAIGTGRIMRWTGVAGALALSPLVTAAGFAALAVSPGLGVLIVAMTARRASGYAVERPAREVLFTVVSREEKYKAKNFIDTFVYRGGDALSGWLHSSLTAAGLGVRIVSIASIPVALGWLFIAHELGRRQDAMAAKNARAMLDPPPAPCPRER